MNVIGLSICGVQMGLFCNPRSLEHRIAHLYCDHQSDVIPDYMVKIKGPNQS